MFARGDFLSTTALFSISRFRLSHIRIRSNELFSILIEFLPKKIAAEQAH